MRGGDEEGFDQLFQEYFRELHQPSMGLPPHAPIPSTDALVRFCARAGSDTHILVVEEIDGGALAGFAIYSIQFSTFGGFPRLHIEDMYVRLQHRGSGAASLVLRSLADLAHQNGARTMTGWVLKGNGRARAFFSQTGAQEEDPLVLFNYEPGALERLRRPANA